MTKEEYEKLLQSDYWKGFSYSLIKERDFTCEDCGRQFYNQRNKLQVHHLVYRDINPWSYKPEEMVVLCEECHKKRHGFLQEDHKEDNTTQTQDTFGDYTKTYSYNSDVKEERIHHSSSKSETNRRANPIGMSDRDYANNGTPFHKQSRKGNKWMNVFYAAFLSFLLSFGVYSLQKHNNDKEKLHEAPITNAVIKEEVFIDDAPTEDPTSIVSSENKTKLHEAQTTNTGKRDKVIIDDTPEEAPARIVPSEKRTEVVEQKQSAPLTQPEREKTVSELLDERTHANAVRRAGEVGVSTEGTTTEILDRINHANTVRRAKEVGVSAEGTTTEILDRINHANTVRRAKEVGVSAEGTTTEILDRINHANTVRRAKEVGVSVEGTTTEILDRINHANTVRRAKEVGVSAEGTTTEILDRINHANTVRRAKEVGVSVEGTTTEILDRINHANTVRRAKELGVSTEGTTTEILDRITRKNLERLNY